jgi:PAN domain
MRHALTFMCLSVALLTCGSASAQVGYDRPGDDYTSFVVKSGDPAACAATCEHDARCRAWAFSYPVTEHADAMCWLKSEVTKRIARTCCISGVRGAGVTEPRTGATEFSIDRLGGDYRNVELAADPTGAACKSACEAEGRCRAWTYVRPGYVGPTARCLLKDRITPPRRKPCCISGVVR